MPTRKDAAHVLNQILHLVALDQEVEIKTTPDGRSRITVGALHLSDATQDSILEELNAYEATRTIEVFKKS